MAVSADVSRLHAAAPDYAREMELYQKRNFALLVLDGACFAFAISLLSETTIIPAFVQALSGSTLLVGLVAATFAVGRYLPQLVGAHLVQGRSRRKPLLLAIVLAERVGILAIAIAAQLIGVIDESAVLVLFFIAFCGYAITTGLIGPVYGDFVAKSLTRGRGVFFGTVQLLGGLLGFSAAMVAEYIIKTSPFPTGNQLCFWISFGLSFLSIAFVASLREIPYPHVQPRGRFWATVASIPGLLAENDAYRQFLAARIMFALATCGVGFVVVDGMSDVLALSDAALLAAVFIFSQATLGFALGVLGNYFGWKLIVFLGGCLVAVGMSGALLAHSLPVYIVIFIALGGANAVTVIGDPNMSIEMAPAERTSLYLGTTSTLLAPFFIFGPLIAGALIDVVGYDAIFAVALAFAVAGMVLALRMPEPRKIVKPDAVGQPGAIP